MQMSLVVVEQEKNQKKKHNKRREKNEVGEGNFKIKKLLLTYVISSLFNQWCCVYINISLCNHFSHSFSISVLLSLKTASDDVNIFAGLQRRFQNHDVTM